MGCRQFASGPLANALVIKASQEFIPVFVDTLKDLKTTKRFNEKYGSYPVLRIHHWRGQDIAGRIDGNLVAGRIPVVQVLKQMHYAKMVITQEEMRLRQNGNRQFPPNQRGR